MKEQQGLALVVGEAIEGLNNPRALLARFDRLVRVWKAGVLGLVEGRRKERLAPAAPKLIDTAVVRDRDQPGSEGFTGIEGGEPLKSPQEGFL